MLREARARYLAFATVVVVVGLAALFAWARNPPGDAVPAVAAAEPSNAARLDAGRAAFERLGCARCHAVEGRGNPARPLDGIGARLDRAALRDWALGTGVASEELSSGVLRTKARAAGDADLDVLIEYLAQQRR